MCSNSTQTSPVSVTKSHLNDILKSAETLQSFVIEEIALTELLERAWKPIGKKIVKQVSKVLDFKKMEFHPQNGFDIDMWLPDDLYDEDIKKVWNKIEKQVRKYISQAYQRGIDEEGELPFTTKSFAKKSVSSVFAERKAQNEEIMTRVIAQGFRNYGPKTVMPGLREGVGQLYSMEQLNRAAAAQEQQLLDDESADLLRMEMFRKMRVEALNQARSALLGKLNDMTSNCQVASGISNLMVSRAHHFGFLDWAERNGIEYYRISALADAKTCKGCGEMDGKVFKVSDAQAFRSRYLEIADDKDALKAEMPFLAPKDAPDIGGIDLSQYAQSDGIRQTLSSVSLATPDGAKYSFHNGQKYLDLSSLSPDEYEDFINRITDDWKVQLTDDIKMAIFTYKTDAFKAFNRYMRTGVTGGLLSRLTNEQAEQMLGYLREAYTWELPENMVVFRGSGTTKWFSDVLGTTNWESRIGKSYVLDKSVMSSSTLYDVAKENFSLENEGLMLKIYAKKGSKSMIYLDLPDLNKGVNDDDFEMLIKDGRKFKILGVDRSKAQPIIEVELLD